VSEGRNSVSHRGRPDAPLVVTGLGFERVTKIPREIHTHRI
jgi:hypothetical protein